MKLGAYLNYYQVVFGFQGRLKKKKTLQTVGTRTSLYLFIWKFPGQLLAYGTAIATQDSSYVCHLDYSSRQCWILNPLSEAQDRAHFLIDPSWVH